MEIKVDDKFKQLETEITPYKPILAKAADAVLDQDVSMYPIFVIHQQTIEIGLPIASPKTVKGKWSANASTLEEFVAKRLIENERVENFKKVYKNPETHLCLFILSDLGATFVFIPRI